MIRRLALVLLLTIFAGSATAQEGTSRPLAEFKAFLDDLWPDAQAKGVTRTTFDRAFANMTFDPRIMPITHRQAEYGRPVAEYVGSAVSKPRIDTGARKATEHKETLVAVENTFSVDAATLLAIWGVETSYGAVAVRWDVFRSLATLAGARYRHPYFRNELIQALRILQEGHVPREQMLSSWAGALGQPQFMPSSFFTYAVDASGDGKRDIWTSVPDVLGSIANYFKKEGWTTGMPWGFEVIVPSGFDYRKSRASFAEWSRLGLRRADGGAYPDGDGILFFPSGVPGPGFVVTENFTVIKRYNNSDVYALAVGHLSDRIAGRGGAFRTPWPANDVQLSREARITLQRTLKDLGYPVKDFQGRIDFDLRDAIREQQVKFGMRPDGHPTAALLTHLGVKPD